MPFDQLFASPLVSIHRVFKDHIARFFSDHVDRHGDE